MPDRVGRHAPWVVIFVKASEALVPELPDDHDGLYGITVHPSSGFRRRQTATWKTLKFSIPLLLGVPLSDEPFDCVYGKIFELVHCTPGLLERFLDRVRREIQIGEKARVRAVLPVSCFEGTRRSFSINEISKRSKKVP